MSLPAGVIAAALASMNCAVDEAVLSYVESLLAEDGIDDEVLLTVLAPHAPPDADVPAEVAALRVLQRSSAAEVPPASAALIVATSAKPAKKPKAGATSKRGRTKFEALDVSVGSAAPREGVLSSSDSDRVCRFYLAGACTRDDCPFLHDVSSLPCAFYSTPGGCSSGAACKFMHHASLLPPSTSSDASTDLSDDELLQLLQQLDDSLLDAMRSAEAMSHDESTIAAPVEVTDTAFPSLHTAAGRADTVSTVPEAHGLTPSASDLYQSLFHFGPRAVRTTAADASTSDAGGKRPSRAFAGLAAQIARSLPRLDTGGSVAALYSKARGDAEAMARARNSAFDRAARAFSSGDRGTAISLARQAQQLDDRMRAEHGAAADAIFSVRNHGVACRDAQQLLKYTHMVTLASGESVPGVVMVDLHGLHPHEAVSVVQHFSAGAVHVATPTWVALMCGTRSHSSAYGKGGGSISDAVLEGLASLGVEHYTPSVLGTSQSGGSTDGVIMLRLVPS